MTSIRTHKLKTEKSKIITILVHVFVLAIAIFTTLVSNSS